MIGSLKLDKIPFGWYLYRLTDYRAISMSQIVLAYSALAIAIVSEVTGSAYLAKSEQFTRLGPSLMVVVCYCLAFYLLSQTIRVLPLGVAYAIWAGLGIVLTTLVGIVVLRQSIDLWGMVGIAMIVGGVLVMNILSKTSGH